MRSADRCDERCKQSVYAQMSRRVKCQLRHAKRTGKQHADCCVNRTIFFKEKLNIHTWIALVLTVISLILTNWLRKNDTQTVQKLRRCRQRIGISDICKAAKNIPISPKISRLFLKCGNCLCYQNERTGSGKGGTSGRRRLKSPCVSPVRKIAIGFIPISFYNSCSSTSSESRKWMWMVSASSTMTFWMTCRTSSLSNSV